MQKARRAARELALNLLYQVDVAGLPYEEALQTAIENTGAQPEVIDYTERLTRGIIDHLQELDQHIRRLASDWPPERQPSVDRNVLRIAIYEMIYEPGVPAVVSVNEAVELAKKYSTNDSGKFVNGVLAGFLRNDSKKVTEEERSGSADS
jgi:transcription antitermination protein NusB